MAFYGRSRGWSQVPLAALAVALWRGNEPAGMTFVNERPFTALDEAPWGNTLTSPGATIVSDALAPKSPSSVVSFNYPAGYAADGSAPTNTELGHTGFRYLYVTYWCKYSSPWQGHESGTNKQIYVWHNGTNPFIFLEGAAAGTSEDITIRVALQAVVSSPVGTDGWVDMNLAPTAKFTRGSWDLVELLLTGNTAGAANGAVDIYLNGVHTSHMDTIQFSAAATSWDLTRIYPVWGGVGTIPVAADQSWSVDHFYISGKA